jgi:lysophospholipase L1-like esterase
VIGSGSTVLFQGDSITDAGRDRSVGGPNDQAGLGGGYACLAAARLLSARPADGLRFLNRGVAGDKVADLEARWERDCVALRPNVVSILIGVNDFWHKLDGHADGDDGDYEREYRALLERTRAALPTAVVIVGEPFVLRCGVVDARWFPEFDRRRAVAAALAGSYADCFIPHQALFDEASGRVESPSYWALDGVHPTLAGHRLMADAWLRLAAGC